MITFVMTISFLVRAPMATLGAAIVGTTIALLYQPHFHFSTSDTSSDYKERRARRQKDEKCSLDKIRVSEVYFLFCEQPFGIFIVTTSNIFHLPEHTTHNNFFRMSETEVVAFDNFL